MKKRSLSGLVITGMFLMMITGCEKKEVFMQANAEGSVVKASRKVFYEMPAAGEAAVMAEKSFQESEVKEVVKVAAVGGEDLEILTKAAELLKGKGYGVEILSCEDYDSPNQMLLEEEADANLFQHFGYLERYNIEKGTNLTKDAAIYFQPMAVYPGKTKELSKIEKGSVFFVPADTTGYARALLLLQQEGIVKLMDDADLMAVEGDIIKNPREIKLIKTEEDKMWEKRMEADFIICTASYLIAQGEDPENGCLAKEKEDSQAAKYLSRILVINEENKEKLRPLTEVLVSEQMKEFIQSYFHGRLSFIGTVEAEEEGGVE